MYAPQPGMQATHSRTDSPKIFHPLSTLFNNILKINRKTNSINNTTCLSN